MDKKIYERPVIIKQQMGFMNKFGSAPANQPLTHIDNVSVVEMAEKFGSPLFVFSEKKIRQNYRNLNRIFKTRYPKVQFAWSYKTNYLNAVCSLFHQEGAWAEVVSEFEYERARKLGVKGENIIFNGPDKTIEGIKKAIEEKAKIHIDHFDELYDIINITEKYNLKADVGIRVNMDTGIYPKWDRFGFNYENGEAVQALKRIISNERLNLVGLHTHIGTYIMSTEPYKIAAQKLVVLANMLIDQYDIKLDYIDLGGGLPSHNTLKGQYLEAEQLLPTLEQYADAITSPLYDLNLSPSEFPTLFLENGRVLIDDAGFLVSKVLANKRLSDGRRSTVIDAGVNLLFTSFWFKHKVRPAQVSSTYTESATLYGPLCMNIDIIRDDVVLPTLKKGEYLVIMYVGAYSVTQWMQFITLRPNIVMITEEGKIEQLRKSENLDYIMEQEILPEKLKEFSI